MAFAVHKLNNEMRVQDGEPSRFLSRKYDLKNFRMVWFLPKTRLGLRNGGWAVGFVLDGKFMQIYNLPTHPDGTSYINEDVVIQVGRRVKPRNLARELHAFDASELEGEHAWHDGEETKARIWHGLARGLGGSLGGNMDLMYKNVDMD